MTSTSVRIATYSADPPGCDSFHAQDPESFVLIPAIADSLAYVDIDGKICPGLASAWRRVDPVTMDFDLREGVRFHDGEPFDAASVVATLNAHVHPETRSFVGGSILSSIKDCEQLGPNKVRITTHGPDAMFLNRLALFAQIYPKSMLARGAEALVKTPVGTGAYRLESWARGEQIVLRRNEGHWANRATIDELVFPIVPQNEWIDRLAAGDLDIAINVGADDAVRARDIPGLVVRERAGVVPHFFLLRNDGPLADRRVRQALNYAIHKPLLAHVASHGAAVPQHGVAREGGIGYRDDLARYSYDVELAKRLLEEAGWAKGFKLRGIITDASAGLYSIVREFLRRIGVSLEAEIVPRGEWMRRVPVPRMMGQAGYDGDFLLSAFDDPISHTLFQHFMQFFDKAPFSALHHDDYNRRLFEALTTVDESLDQKVADLERFVADEALWLLTTSESVFSVAREGFEIPLPVTGHFDYPCLWNIKAPKGASHPEPLARRPRGDDPDVNKLLDATAFPGNLFLPGGAAGLQSPALRTLWRNVESQEERWRRTSEAMIRQLVDQAAAQKHLDNVARSTKQTGIVLLAEDGRVAFVNVGYELVSRCPPGTPLQKLLWSGGTPAWEEIRTSTDRAGAWAGVVDIGPEPSHARRVFLTVTRATSELKTQAGYACTFTDYSREEDRLRMKAEAETAALVQKALVPRITNDPNIATYYNPASETGGDWFFVSADERRLTLMVGDVTGHGTAPALVTAAVVGATSVLDIDSAPAEHVFRQLDGVVARTGFGQYQMTCLYLQVERATKRYRLASAAHPHPMFVSNGRVTRTKPQPCPLLGEGGSGGGWPVIEGQLDPGTLLLLYTDGVIENTNRNGQPHGMGRLIRSLERVSQMETCDRILHGIVDGAAQFYADARPDDDVTLLLARVG